MSGKYKKIRGGGRLAALASAVVLTAGLMQVGVVATADAYPSYGSDRTKEKDEIPVHLLSDFGRLKEKVKAIAMIADEAERLRDEAEKAEAAEDKAKKARAAEAKAREADRIAADLRKEMDKQDLSNEQLRELNSDVNDAVWDAWEASRAASKSAGIPDPQ